LNALAVAGRGGKKGGKFHDNKDNAAKSDHAEAECWNCSKKGHIRRNCHSKKKKNTGKYKESANATTGGEEFAFTTTFASASMAHDNSPPTMAKTDVYDSGASTHM